MLFVLLARSDFVLLVSCLFLSQLQWKAYGSDAMAQAIETCFDNALYLRDRLAESEGFRLLLTEPECTNVCFWYIPESMRGQEETEDWWLKLSTVCYLC